MNTMGIFFLQYVSSDNHEIGLDSQSRDLTGTSLVINIHCFRVDLQMM